MASAPNDVQFNVKWYPFFLTPPNHWDQWGPEAKTKGVNKQEFYEFKFGKGRTENFVPRLKKAFLDAGCGGEMTMEGNTGPTLDSHRLIAVSAQHGLQDSMVEELFKNYFLEGKTICDPDVLLAAAEKVGLPEARTVVMDPEAGLSEVRSQLKLSQQGQLNVSGVPFFVISNDRQPRPKQLTLSGAQPPDLLVEAFEEMYP